MVQTARPLRGAHCLVAPPGRSMMSAVAVIDLGSNSICLLVARLQADGELVVIEKIKDAARLRDEIDSRGRLSAIGMQRALSALQHFATVVQRYDAKVRVVATAALRAASNADVFVARAKSETGLEVEIISGDVEARLAYKGVLFGMGELPGDALCADVGGGSTELVLGRNGVALETCSVPVGALTVTRDLLGPDPVSRAQIAAAIAGIREQFRPTIGAFANRRGLFGVATSGTIQRIARISLALSGAPRQDVQGLLLTRADYDQVTEIISKASTNAQRLRIAGMDPVRADILLGGALIYQVLALDLGLAAWTVSMAGLRTGVLAELLEAQRTPALDLTQQI